MKKTIKQCHMTLTLFSNVQLEAVKAEAEAVRAQGPTIAARREKAARDLEAAVQVRNDERREYKLRER